MMDKLVLWFLLLLRFRNFQYTISLEGNAKSRSTIGGRGTAVYDPSEVATIIRSLLSGTREEEQGANAFCHKRTRAITRDEEEEAMEPWVVLLSGRQLLKSR